MEKKAPSLSTSHPDLIRSALTVLYDMLLVPSPMEMQCLKLTIDSTGLLVRERTF